jgi:hypothetical protein
VKYGPGTVLALTALTLTDLMFVASTAAVGGEAMILLLTGAALAPIVRRFSGRPWYLTLWTLVVLGVLARLVLDFTRHGPTRLLEDGLILAATSQVHLLHNVGGKQKPDLLFLNSFTVVLVSSFFAPGLAFSVLLVAYAFVLLHAMRTAELGEAAVDVRAELPLALGTIAVTGLLFAFLPRSFDRAGLPLANLPLISRVQEAGFTPEVDLRPRGRTALDPRVVMVVERSPGDAREFPAYWRGATAVLFDGVRWLGLSFRGGSPELGPRWKPVLDWDGVRWESGRAAQPTPFRVGLLDLRESRLCLPDDTARVVAGSEVQFVAYQDGSLAIDGRDHLRTPLPLEVFLAKPHAAELTVPTESWRKAHTSLPKRLPPEVGAIAAEAKRRARAGTSDRELARTVAAWIAAQHRYVLPGEPGAAESIGEFMAPSGAGHCELFATATALVVRALGIPCRIATGYRSVEIAGEERLQIRRLHAHAWVEVLDPGSGWWVLDATPAPGVRREGGSLWGSVSGALGDAWGALLRFNEGNRKELLAALLAFPARHPLRCGVIALLLAGFVAVVAVQRRARVPSEVRAYEKKVGGLRAKEETPRELLARLGDAEDGRDREWLRVATARHEAARYAAR